MRLTFLLSLTAALVWASPAAAQQVEVNVNVVSDATAIDRDVADLSDLLRVPAPDRDTVNSALVFTGKGGAWTHVKCVGLNASGRVVGKAWTRVRPNGVSILFASDLTNGADIIGSARCASRSRVVGSGFLLVPGGLSQLPVEQNDGSDAVRMHFPIIATY